MSAKSILKTGMCLLLFAVVPIVFLSCPSTTTPKTYPRIVIDTYIPQLGGFGVDTFITLFDASGDPDIDLWQDGGPQYTEDAPPDSIAEDDNSNPIFANYARIDYAGGLTSGTYYIRVRCQTSTDFGGPYAIRVVEYVDSTGDKDTQYPSADWKFDSPDNTSDAPYDDPPADDTPASKGKPIYPVTIGIGDRLNRYLTPQGDVDWFKLVLP